jgi:CheY-like chemotaxis protein
MTAPKLPPVPPKGGTILVVDDTEHIRRIIVEIFRREGYQTIEAQTGIEALRLVEMYAADLIAATLDLDMPGMNGKETLAKLSSCAPFLPILIVTGEAIDGLQGRIPGTPGVSYVSKPFTQARLLDGLRTVLDEMKPRRPRER